MKKKLLLDKCIFKGVGISINTPSGPSKKVTPQETMKDDELKDILPPLQLTKMDMQ